MRDNTLALLAPEILAVVDEKIRTALLFCSKLQLSCLLVPDV